MGFNLKNEEGIKSRYQHLFLFVVTGIIFSSAVAVAKSIPGVTRPYDPGAYYSETEISYRDSTYTPFTMMDLARNGYMVRDVMLNKKSIISDIKSYAEMIDQIEALLHSISDMTSLDRFDVVDSLKHYLKKIEKKQTDSDVLNEDDFHDTEHYPQAIRYEKYFQLAMVYYKAIEAAKENERQSDILSAALETVGQTKGFLGAEQAKTKLESVSAVLKMQQNILLSHYLKTVAVHEKGEVDRSLNDWQQAKEGMAYLVADPYQPSEKEKKQYVRSEGIGFIDF